MSFTMQDNTAGDDSEIMSEINMTPLVDVMLVLLIIFIITVPVLKHAVQVALPQASSQPQNLEAKKLELSINAQGIYYWGQQATPLQALRTQLQAASQQAPQPELHIRADKNVRYEFVAQAMASAQQAGLQKIGFVTDPTH